MPKPPEVHWAEGMFLRPQHLQLFARQTAGAVADAWRQCQPFFWGLSRVAVAEEQLEAFTFHLQAFEAVLKDGTRLHLPTNLHLDPRDFKEALSASEGTLTVYLGVPILREGEPNTVGSVDGPAAKDLRYRVDVVPVADENRGGEPRDLEIRKYGGRFFFGDEDREGYECLPVARIRHAGQGKNVPVLDREFIPPVLDVAAWPALAARGEEVAKKVEAKYRFLKAEVTEGRMVLDAEGTGGWQPVFKLQIVGSFLHLLRQLTTLPGIHPFQLYLELSRLAGELAIFAPEGGESLGVPLYDHDHLGRCYRDLVYTLNRLLDQILSGGFIRCPFVVSEDLLIARLEEEWISGKNEIYLCIESDLDERQIQSRLITAKLGAPEDLQILRQRRLFGLDIELMRRAPGGLPARENLHYFSIAQEGVYWETVLRQQQVAIAGGIDPKLRFLLYIVLRPES